VLKKVAVFLVIVSLFGLVAGCSPKASDKPKVALLLPGNISDQGWNATAYNGLKLIEKDLGAEVAYMENVPQSNFEEVFRRYAQEGYRVIFAHGFQFGDAAMKVAKDFPNTWFIVTSTTISQAPNVASLNNDAIQAGFLAGALSALMSKTKTIGLVVGMDFPSITTYADGFKAGAKYIDPSVNALTGLTGDFTDAAKAKEMAMTFIGQGADVVSHDADQAGLGVLEAVKEKNILTVGAISDQWELAPDQMVNSVSQDLSLAFEVITQKALDKTIEAKCYYMGVNEGTVALAGWHNFDSTVPQTVKDRMNQIVADIKSGALNPASLVGN